MAEWGQRFKGVDLQSEGHVRLCEALEAAGLLLTLVEVEDLLWQSKMRAG